MRTINECIEEFNKALKRLEEIINSYNETNNELLIDGIIQRFEFCTELSWRMLKDYMIIDLASPKAVYKEAYNRGILNSEEDWLILINDRNLTSHAYDENVADEIKDHVINIHYNLFNKLSEKMEVLINND